MENKMGIMSTAFDHNSINKETGIASDGLTRNQIDHILMESKHSKAVKDLRSHRRTETTSDDILVTGKTQQLMPNTRIHLKNRLIKYN